MKPTLINRAELAKIASERWTSQMGVAHAALIALGPSPSPADVEATVGNGSWTRITCDDCGPRRTVSRRRL